MRSICTEARAVENFLSHSNARAAPFLHADEAPSPPAPPSAALVLSSSSPASVHHLAPRSSEEAARCRSSTPRSSTPPPPIQRSSTTVVTPRNIYTLHGEHLPHCPSFVRRIASEDNSHLLLWIPCSAQCFLHCRHPRILVPLRPRGTPSPPSLPPPTSLATPLSLTPAVLHDASRAPTATAASPNASHHTEAPKSARTAATLPPTVSASLTAP